MPQPSRPTMTPSMMRTPRFFLRFASHTFCAFRGPAPRAFRLSSRAAYARPIPKLIWLGWPPDFAGPRRVSQSFAGEASRRGPIRLAPEILLHNYLRELQVEPKPVHIRREIRL